MPTLPAEVGVLTPATAGEMVAETEPGLTMAGAVLSDPAPASDVGCASPAAAGSAIWVQSGGARAAYAAQARAVPAADPVLAPDGGVAALLAIPALEGPLGM
ncbi:MAG: hypothetical protein NTU94_13120 [Planctomycetota bacterium]|nr:hypothetical protein [Planctomycetota bacterium]